MANDKIVRLFSHDRTTQTMLDRIHGLHRSAIVKDRLFIAVSVPASTELCAAWLRQCLVSVSIPSLHLATGGVGLTIEQSDPHKDVPEIMIHVLRSERLLPRLPDVRPEVAQTIVLGSAEGTEREFRYAPRLSTPPPEHCRRSTRSASMLRLVR